MVRPQFVYTLPKYSAGAKAFEVEGPNLKVEGSKFLINFSPGKACRA